jgi:hypothetical protein
MLIGPVLIIVLILAIEAFLTFAVKDPSLRMASLDILPVVINLLASMLYFGLLMNRRGFPGVLASHAVDGHRPADLHFG